MEQLKCKSCGAKIIKDGEGYVCEHCGTAYNVEPQRRGKSSKIQSYFERLKESFSFGYISEARITCSKILDIDPENRDALMIKTYLQYCKKPNGRYSSLAWSQTLKLLNETNWLEKNRDNCDNFLEILKITLKQEKNSYTEREAHSSLMWSIGYLQVGLNQEEQVKTLKQLRKKLIALNKPEFEFIIKFIDRKKIELFEKYRDYGLSHISRGRAEQKKKTVIICIFCAILLCVSVPAMFFKEFLVWGMIFSALFVTGIVWSVKRLSKWTTKEMEFRTRLRREKEELMK